MDDIDNKVYWFKQPKALQPSKPRNCLITDSDTLIRILWFRAAQSFGRDVKPNKAEPDKSINNVILKDPVSHDYYHVPVKLIAETEQVWEKLVESRAPVLKGIEPSAKRHISNVLKNSLYPSPVPPSKPDTTVRSSSIGDVEKTGRNIYVNLSARNMAIAAFKPN